MLICTPFSTAPATAQNTHIPPRVNTEHAQPESSIKSIDHKATFTLTVGTPTSSTPTSNSPEPIRSGTLSPLPPLTLSLEDQSPASTEPPRTGTWKLDTWTPLDAAEPIAELSAHFAFHTTDPLPLFSSQADSWTRSVYSRDAEQLTPLTPGKEMFTWELTDEITLAGVGARRLFTDRSRAFVVSAEAGFELSPHIGLMVGYELLQTSAGGTLPDDAGGDSLFARFQLRF